MHAVSHEVLFLKKFLAYNNTYYEVYVNVL